MAENRQARGNAGTEEKTEDGDLCFVPAMTTLNREPHILTVSF